jgi:hypothetical protein
VSDKPVVPNRRKDPLPLEGEDDLARLKDGFYKLLREPDEKVARRIIAALGRPEGTEEFEALLRYWNDHRQPSGWKVS